MHIGLDNNHALNAVNCPVMATLITADLDATLLAYSGVLGYTHIQTEPLSSAMAKHFGADSLSGARTALLAPKSGAPVFLRCIEAADARRPSASCGWFALEICVQDVEALYETLKTSKSITPFAPPKPLAFTDRVYPMQCQGPSGEIIYLNQVRGSLPEIDLPIASSPVDHLFIAILSAADMESSIEFYEELLDMRVNERHEIPYKTINRIHGLPLDTLHKLSTLGGERSVALEIDQWPAQSGSPKLLNSKQINEGIFMVSFLVDDLSAANSNLISGAKSITTAPYNGVRSAIALGPSGERVELIAFK